MKQAPFKHRDLNLNLENILHKKWFKFKRLQNHNCRLICSSGKWQILMPGNCTIVLSKTVDNFSQSLIEATLKLQEITK